MATIGVIGMLVSLAAVTTGQPAGAQVAPCDGGPGVCSPNTTVDLGIRWTGTGQCVWTITIDWADGDIDVLTTNHPGAGQTTTYAHTYAEPGIYTVVFTLEGDRPSCNSNEWSVVVQIQGPVVMCGSVPATIVGTDGDDVIRGTAGRDVIAALGGNDTVRSLGGNDAICGGPGNDKLIGGAGRDAILGEEGHDVIRGGGDVDAVHGGPGNDVIAGQGGDDLIFGGGGKDKLIGGKGDDSLNGHSGRDRLLGSAGNDSLNGGDGSDRCKGGKGRDTLTDCER